MHNLYRHEKIKRDIIRQINSWPERLYTTKDLRKKLKLYDSPEICCTLSVLRDTKKINYQQLGKRFYYWKK